MKQHLNVLKSHFVSRYTIHKTGRIGITQNPDKQEQEQQQQQSFFKDLWALLAVKNGYLLHY